jgi:hypothetical protein
VAAATSANSAPATARSALFAVTTGLPARKGGLDQLVGRVDAADELDHDVDVGADHQGRASLPMRSAGMAVAGAGQVGYGDADQLEADAGPGGDVVSWRVSRSSASAPPTLPQPNRATRTVGDARGASAPVGSSDNGTGCPFRCS